ncbi:diaminopimelate decarboxylase [Candidatus Blochmanniella camponoti]|uniref:Diaminopimelate decarboxylase n=1 Tax=Candidatus Blochmanniella camponoti TaxID=108080 RepID=A0AAE9I8Y3_9ENTR|nr:diaminopimelate decarboxylase [Candidatus Blochmannia herculeanus]URJ24679.1 diaminopimelate decarboxylase [Candidatus Blochmannia herculeanus]URJ26714.1 diaminopimelate decarboxylase [Candidatus Blochmannia herculeanus]URJ27481.1 diaminopimelate decarboxylase [Candidatus Blochmannia herculeanus]
MTHNIFAQTSALTYESLKKLHQKYKGPVWVYDASIIINRITQLKQFDVIRYAQKSCSNIHILRLMHNYEVKVDAVSLGEIERALLAGFKTGKQSNEIVFTADILEEETLLRISELNIVVNAGSIDMLAQLGACSPGHKIWLRINPGFGHGHNQKTNTGGENSKHGIWHEDIPIALSYIHHYDLQLIGLHMHIGSGVRYDHLSKVCNAMVQQILKYKIDVHVISAGGGLTIPYQHNDIVLDVNHYFRLWNNARQYISQYLNHTVTLEIEPGRFLVAESGILITQIRAVKNMGNRHFVLIDAGYNDLMRPVMYGSYHHISLVPGDDRSVILETLCDTVVGGPLCESGDVFTQNMNGTILARKLPCSAKVGDYLIFHDTGAYGASMSSNYNTRPLLPEVLFENGQIRQIRRKQKLEDLFMLETIEQFNKENC